jgi:hypothetical protein
LRDRVIVAPERRHHDIKFKRLETGSFQIPAVPAQAVAIEMTATQLSLILSAIDLASTRQRMRYRRPTLEAENRPTSP